LRKKFTHCRMLQKNPPQQSALLTNNTNTNTDTNDFIVALEFFCFFLFSIDQSHHHFSRIGTLHHIALCLWDLLESTHNSERRLQLA
jgi:hypothetical protein